MRAYEAGAAPRPPRAQKRRPGPILVPAAARGPERHLSPEETNASLDAIDLFATTLGGRDALLRALAIADTGQEADRVVNILLDPRYADWSLRRICKLAGITIADLFAAYKKAVLAAAHIEAAHRIAARLLPVVDDVMLRAAPYDTVCSGCQGVKAGPKDPPCLVCHGTLVEHHLPDVDRQKLALELGHLTEKKAGLIVQQNTLAPTVLAGNGHGALEQLNQAVGELLFNPNRRRALAPALDPPSDVPSRHDPIDLPLPIAEPEEDGDDEDEDEEADEPLVAD